MEFQKYSKIVNAYKQKEINMAQLQYDGPWIVTEKVHGANFSFWTDGIDVKVASRNQFVDETFYNASDVVEQYRDRIFNFFHSFGFEQGETIAVFGELYGQGIQKEINYGEKDFIAFDLMHNGKFVESFFDVIADELSNEGIPVIPHKVCHTLEEALEQPNDEPTALSDSGDTMEGTVIRPMIEQQFGNGKRMIFKNKNEKFTEKKVKNAKIDKPLTDDERRIFDLVNEYILESRVANVISKMGTITNKDFGNIMKATMDDVREDYMDDTGEDFTKSDEWGSIKKMVYRELSNTVRREFVKHI